MRVVAIAVLSALVAPAFGQITAAEGYIQDAFAALHQEPEIMLVLDGTDQLGSRINNFYSNAFYKWEPLNPLSLIKSDLMDSLNGVKAHRIDADGTTLWAYDYNRNTYSTYRYGSYNGGQRTVNRADMFDQMTSATQGTSIYLARMLREIYSGDVAQYRTWFPMANISVVSNVGRSSIPSMQDPIIPSRTYTGDDFNLYVVYTYNTRPARSSAFHFTRTDVLKPWNLSEIFYGDLQRINASTSRLVEWRIAVYTGILPSSTNYVFIPPTNARAIANLRGQGG